MKRRAILQAIRSIAADNESVLILSEGGSHTRVELNGQLITTIPTHREIAEGTARNILRLVREATQ